MERNRMKALLLRITQNLALVFLVIAAGLHDVRYMIPSVILYSLAWAFTPNKRDAAFDCSSSVFKAVFAYGLLWPDHRWAAMGIGAVGWFLSVFLDPRKHMEAMALSQKEAEGVTAEEKTGEEKAGQEAAAEEGLEQK